MRRHPAHRIARPGGPGPRRPSATCASNATTRSCSKKVSRGDQLAGPHVRPDRRAAHRARASSQERLGPPTREVTDDGRLLARIYSESDLLVAECLRTGAWAGLQPAELAAVLSAVVLRDARRRRPSAPSTPSRCPRTGCGRRWPRRRRLSVALRADEQPAPDRPVSREPDEGFVGRHLPLGHAPATWPRRWPPRTSTGSGTQLPAGDFVRWCRQVLDLLDQVRNAAPDPALRSAAKRAIDDVRRGVVAVDAGRVMQTLRWERRIDYQDRGETMSGPQGSDPNPWQAQQPAQGEDQPAPARSSPRPRRRPGSPRPPLSSRRPKRRLAAHR